MHERFYLGQYISFYHYIFLDNKFTVYSSMELCANALVSRKSKTHKDKPQKNSDKKYNEKTRKKYLYTKVVS